MTDERKATLLAYCRLEKDEVDPGLLEMLYEDAVDYMAGAGVSVPEEGSGRRAKYDMCVNALVLDAHDNRGTQMGANLQENKAFRRRLNQLKLTEPVSNLDTGTGASVGSGV